MEELVERCAGVDVGKSELRVCARVPGPKGTPDELVRSFGTTTRELLVLRDWLDGLGVSHVAMESTGVYWKPVYYALEGGFELLLVNAAHVKHVPGRKTDTIDAAWLAQLLAHGLLRPSFVPPPPFRDLRELTRYRRSLVEERTRMVARIEKTLEDAGVKLGAVASSVAGVSGRAMLRAMCNGEHDPEALAQLARGRLRAKLGPLRDALDGRFRDHHRFLVGQMLDHLERLDAEVDAIGTRVEELLVPFAPQAELVQTIPGVGRRAAQCLLAEIGVDMTRFPTPQHLASWAGVCPAQHESAGRRKGVRNRRGSRHLRAVLVECAWAASRTRGTYLAERHRQVLRRRRSPGKAAIATAHEILDAAWWVLSTGQPYRDPGPEALHTRSAEATARRAVAQLRHLGYQVDLTPVPAAPPPAAA